MGVTGMRNYNQVVLEEMKSAYQGLTVLFKESYDDAFDSTGNLVDDEAWNAHKMYSEALSDVGNAITGLQDVGRFI